MMRGKYFLPNDIEDHEFEEHQRVLTCKACGAKLKGQQNFIHHQKDLCPEADLACSCGVSFKRKSAQIHECAVLVRHIAAA